MLQIIMGLKGSGKTKRLVDMVREAVNEGTGDVVVIEKERKLTFNIPYQARLIDAGDYDIGSYEFLKGIICGVHAGNYDITHFFIDNFYKLVNDKAPDALETFIAWLDKFAAKENISFVVSLSVDPENVPESVRKSPEVSRRISETFRASSTISVRSSSSLHKSDKSHMTFAAILDTSSSVRLALLATPFIFRSMLPIEDNSSSSAAEPSGDW